MTIRLILIALFSVAVAGCAEIHTRVLSDDTFDGRNNNTAGSVKTQDYLIAALQELSIPGLDSSASGDAAYKQVFTNGTNILAVIPGTDLADEYIMIGAHYDHIAGCFQVEPGDTICNGATDNAAGVAAALDIALHFANDNNAPRRSVILAFWDREEDGLLGSGFYVNNPLVPLSDTVAYINFDILGSNLLPGLRPYTIAVGAETGGAAFRAAVENAGASQPLQLRQFSAIFGQNRSDYANLIGAGVPTVFFSDSTGPCYHTSGDDASVVDFDKLAQQVQIALDLSIQLADAQVTPSFNGAAPLATFADAESLNVLIQAALGDLGRFSPNAQASIQSWASTIAAIVAAGPGSFGGSDVNNLLGIAVQLVGLLATGECDGFLAEEQG